MFVGSNEFLRWGNIRKPELLLQWALRKRGWSYWNPTCSWESQNYSWWSSRLGSFYPWTVPEALRWLLV